METTIIDVQLAEYVAKYFYDKGYEDGHNEKVQYNRNKKLDSMIKECIENYKTLLIEELRKDNPHHHTNRLDQ